ncbi:MFS transporter [Ferrovibrio sp.]|uniref:MFS transporter n=1 Tax=Ferrovibrio sp. TaxID=1917215 RepID=UPI003D14894F
MFAPLSRLREASPGFRVSLFFIALFAIPGVHLPFWAVWLESRGLSPTEISIMLATAIWLRLVGAPLAAHIVDKSGERRRAIQFCAIASLLSFIGFGFADGFVQLMLVGIVFALVWSPLAPLTENLAMLTATHHGVQYGRIRLWGSISFLVCAYLAGLWLKGRNDDWIYWLILAAMLPVVACAYLLPDIRLPLDRPRAGAPALRLLRNSSFCIFLLTNACLQATHAAFYTFGTLHWRSVGLSDAQIGFLWAEGVIAEVILFAVGQRVVAKLGGVGLLICAVAGGVIRWSLQGVLTDMTSLVLLQVLHAATFGAAHLGAMRLMAEGCEPSASATAQTLYGAANGMMLAIGTMVVGPLYAANFAGLEGGWVYPAMLPLTLLGGVGTWLLWRRRTALRFG